MENFTTKPISKSMPPIDISKTSKKEIKDYLTNTFYLYEYLFSGLINEEAYLQVPDPLRRHLIFYIGHTAVVYMNKLKLAGLASTKNEFFEKVFAVGVDPIYSSELDHEDYNPIWPKLKDVYDYRAEVFKTLNEVIDKHELTLPIKKDTPFWCILLGMEHERIHLETTTCLFRQLDLKWVKKPENFKYAEYSTETFPRNEFLELDAQEVRLGKPDNFPTFGWDNEYGGVVMTTNPVRITKFKITNGEFLEFIRADGYSQRKYWNDEGWAYLENSTKDTFLKSRACHPRWWVKDSNAKSGFRLRLLFDEIELPLNWPVECNYHESKAYCAWLQEKNNLKTTHYRLIKEEEFKLIRGEEQVIEKKKLVGAQRDFGAFNNKVGNLHFEYISATPVDLYEPSPLGFFDTVGNIWEWSETHFRSFPGFKPETFYYDFSGPCFDYHHNVILGSAWSSTGLSCSIYVRIPFRRHFYQNCGFRIVEEQNLEVVTDNVYESKKIIGEYMISNFYEKSLNGKMFSDIKLDINVDYQTDFATKVAEHALDYYKKLNNLNDLSGRKLSAFDIGCGVGKTSFVLARECTKVVGLDFSKSFVDICDKLAKNGSMEYEYLTSGDNFVKAVAEIDKSIDRSRISFIHGDACNLSNEIGPFDIIVAVNLIDRLPNPRQCLIDLHCKLNNAGVLVIVSPYTWLEQYTPQKYWIGGKDGLDTFEELKKLLDGCCFEYVDDRNLTLVIREHQRKYQLCCPHMTVWKKKSFNEEFATSIFKNNK